MPHNDRSIGQAFTNIADFISAGGTLKQKNRKIRQKQVAAKSLQRGQISKKGKAQRKLKTAKQTRTAGKKRGGVQKPRGR